MQGLVNKEVIKRRSQILRDLDIELGRKFREQFIGETAMVLVENDDGQISGRSERYFKVYIKKKDYDKARWYLNRALEISTPTYEADHVLDDRPEALELLEEIKDR